MFEPGSRPYLRLPAVALESRRRVYEVIRSYGSASAYGSHQHVYNMGDEVRGVYAVQAGLVNICVITPEGRICSPSPTFPGEPFSLVEAISHVPHVTCALPVIRTTVWFLDLARFTDLLLDDHSFALNVLRLVSGRLLQYVNQTENLAVLCATSRVVQFLLRAAAEVGREEGGNIVVEPMPTHEDIAELTGITRSSATRLLNALERKGIIVAERKQIKIVDPTRLMALSEVERGGSLGVAPTSAPDC